MTGRMTDRLVFLALMLVMGACTVVFEPASKAGLGISG